MLEHPSLLLVSRDQGPGRASKSARTSTRRYWDILDPTNHRLLGFVCGRVSFRPAWLRWLARPGLEVHEIEDESLLFTLLRPWFHLRAWEVIDAEEHVVGGMSRDRILDRHGRALARTATNRDGAHQSFLDPDGCELATLASGPEGDQLDFAGAAAGNPFAKMLVLAAALALILSSN